jgi:hypothetical protein
MNTCITSFLRLRKYIGLLGLLLPFLVVWKAGVLSSISFSYYTGARDVFVGSLYAIGIFLFCDKGYDLTDTLANRIAGLCAVLVANFPCNGIYAWIHYVSATALFVTLGFISMFLFTKSDGCFTEMKRIRNEIYIICGAAIFTCVIIIAVCAYFNHPIFKPETGCLIPFGIAWLVKGETILKDK